MDKAYGKVRKLVFSAVILLLILKTGSSSAATPISACTEISTPGEYVLTRDIINSNAWGACITISSSNIVFDGRGYTIDGRHDPITSGVWVYDSITTNPTVKFTNITVKNVILTDWDKGILYEASNGSIVKNSASRNWYGIHIKGFDNILMNNDASGNTDTGIYLQTTSNNKLTNNIANYNENGIYIQFSSNNTLTNNIVHYNGNGIYLWGTLNNNIIENNNANYNGNGIRLNDRSNNNILMNNNASGNQENGIYLFLSEGNTLTNNNASGNKKAGIYLFNSNNNMFTNNNLNGNDEDGVYLYESSHNTLTNNNVNRNNNGMRFYDAIENKIYINNFIDNRKKNVIPEVSNIWNSASKIPYNYKGATFTNYLGNHWSDYYMQDDKDGDGVGTTPYSIYFNDKDSYPLVEPIESYELLLASSTPTPVVSPTEASKTEVYPSSPPTLTPVSLPTETPKTEGFEYSILILLMAIFIIKLKK